MNGKTIKISPFPEIAYSTKLICRSKSNATNLHRVDQTFEALRSALVLGACRIHKNFHVPSLVIIHSKYGHFVCHTVWKYLHFEHVRYKSNISSPTFVAIWIKTYDPATDAKILIILSLTNRLSTLKMCPKSVYNYFS